MAADGDGDAAVAALRSKCATVAAALSDCYARAGPLHGSCRRFEAELAVCRAGLACPTTLAQHTACLDTAAPPDVDPESGIALLDDLISSKAAVCADTARALQMCGLAAAALVDGAPAPVPPAVAPAGALDTSCAAAAAALAKCEDAVGGSRDPTQCKRQRARMLSCVGRIVCPEETRAYSRCRWLSLGGVLPLDCAAPLDALSSCTASFYAARNARIKINNAAAPHT